ncbi:hypothetical protein AALB47_19035 [Lachnospiraceae bacterium 54-11]|mgnify:CR=1 FL=1
MEIKLYSTLPSEAVKIRKLVFVEEQGFKNEFDEIVYQYKGEYIMLHAQIQAQQFYEKQGDCINSFLKPQCLRLYCHARLSGII